MDPRSDGASECSYFYPTRAKVTDRATDRREWPRLDLKLNVEFFVEREAADQGTGTTANVSAGGLYFTTPEWDKVRVGEQVGVQLSGLSSYNHGPLFRILHGRATVLRIDAPSAPDPAYRTGGVAVRFDEKPRIGVYRFSA